MAAVTVASKKWVGVIAFVSFFGVVEQQLFIFRDLYWQHESLGSDQKFFLFLFFASFVGLAREFAK